jgi:hypothetical protein
MKPFDQITHLERVTALHAPAGVLDTLSGTISKPDGLRRTLAGEEFGHSAHPMLVQIPIGAWVSAGWLDCLPRIERSAAILTGVGIAAALPAAAAGLVDYGTLGRRTQRRGRACRREHDQPSLPGRLAARPHDRQAAPRPVDRLCRNAHPVLGRHPRLAPRAQAARSTSRDQHDVPLKALSHRNSVTARGRTPWTAD